MSTPLQSQRILRTHTPLMSDRKKSLFGSSDSRSSRAPLPALHSESESDSDQRSLGVAALDSSSSCDELEASASVTPSHAWRETRSRTRRLLKENQEVFIKSPYTLRNFQTRLNIPHGTMSTPATPHVKHIPTTPSSSHSTASACTESSGRGRARRSLAGLIADTESCSSSLKDLTFDTDSGTDTKENTPKKSIRKSNRRKTMTPKFASFKGILSEHKKNIPMDCTVALEVMSPSQMQKTPHSTSEVASPPKLSHHRRVPIEIDESPEIIDRVNKRMWNDSGNCETGPNPKQAKLETPAPKARLSLFNSEKLKEILSTKSFYGKSTSEVPHNVATKVSQILSNIENIHRRSHGHSHKRRQRKPGQINLGVRHRIRKPKFPRYSHIIKLNMQRPIGMKPRSNNVNSVPSSANNSANISDMLYEKDKPDPFDKEHETIEALLSQWTEEEVPSTEPRLLLSMEEAAAKIRSAETLLCFNKSIIEEDNVLINPNAPVQVSSEDMVNGDQELTDLDAIERELAYLDNQLSTLAKENNIDPQSILNFAGVDQDNAVTEVPNEIVAAPVKMFPVFTKGATAQTPTSSKGSTSKSKKIILKSGSDQYVIDAGQKQFGATQCKDCGVIYQIGDPQDEHDHLVHHNAEDVIRFNGWRDENVVGVWEDCRCICLRGNNDNRWRRVTTLLERLVHPQLGYVGQLPRADRIYTYTAYLYIDKKQIVGCLIAEPKNRAHRMIQDGTVDCCSEEEYPVKCGVSRIWTHVSHRRRGVATRLLNCARTSFLYGEILGVDDIAFSAPTPAGRAFAASYTETDNFYIYLD